MELEAVLEEELRGPPEEHATRQSFRMVSVENVELDVFLETLTHPQECRP